MVAGTEGTSRHIQFFIAKTRVFFFNYKLELESVAHLINDKELSASKMYFAMNISSSCSDFINSDLDPTQTGADYRVDLSQFH